jgi:hypothetical protein
MRPIEVSDHARRQCETRGISPADIAGIVTERVGSGRLASRFGSWAVLCGYTDEGWRGASNGDVVWAVVRAGRVATVMFRRDDQPSTCSAFDVERVVA